MSTSSPIFTVLAAIPRGRVITYGQLATAAGMPNGARAVGRAIAKLPADTQLPWHRIINAQGQISLPRGSPGYNEQIRRLTAEGIIVKQGKVALDQYRWQMATFSADCP